MPSERPPLLSFIDSWTSARKLNGVHFPAPTRRSNIAQMRGIATSAIRRFGARADVARRSRFCSE